MAPRSPTCGRILLVDDDASVRLLLSRLLTQDGYDVLSASDGLDAMALANRDHAFDLVITDVVMPRLDGLSLAECLRSARPGIKVLIMSGFSDALADHPLPPDAAFIGKPLDITQFLAAVRQLMSRPRLGAD